MQIQWNHYKGKIKYILLAAVWVWFITGCADAGRDQEVLSGTAVILDANGSTPDFNGEIKRYRWYQLLGKRVNLEDSHSANAHFTAPLVEEDETLVFQLVTTERGGYLSPWKSADTVTVVVHPPAGNAPPVAIAHASAQTIPYGESVRFDANASYDSDGEIVSYRWVESDTNTTLSDQISFTYRFETTGLHHITLIVTDDDGQASQVRLTVDVKAVLASLSIEADTLTPDVNDTVHLAATARYNDDTEKDVTQAVTWHISDETILRIDTNSTLKALHSGTATVEANLEEVRSNSLSIEVKEPVTLQSMHLSPSPVRLRVNTTLPVHVTGTYSDGSSHRVDDAVFSIDNEQIASVDPFGVIGGLAEGSTTLHVRSGSHTLNANVEVTKELNTTNFTPTHFGNTYLDLIPPNATKTAYDADRFCMITGQILTEDGNPLEGVKVSVFQHDEYGSVQTDSNGTYIMPAEGGLQLTMRYTKAGYTTIDRHIQAPIQAWIRTKTVTMLPVDTKSTPIDLSSNVPQIHTSTPVTDQRGERSTTLVFNGVTRATVTAPDGSTRELTHITVRATEFKTPDSMPSDLPTLSAYTYCSDLSVDGVSDDENITFDAPVVMYVDNFLGFDVGEIVPVGYYDRGAGVWRASDNGVVVKLLDTDGDGQVDALDSTGDDQPDDLNGNGDVGDEVAGIADNPAYAAGNTYWRAEMMHFTPWDHNWPYGPPLDATGPNTPEVHSDDSDTPNDCHVNTSSYVTSKSRIFHEDIPVAGTGMTLHYSSKRVNGKNGNGYKYIIDASLDTSNAPASVSEAYVTCSIAGKIFRRTVSLNQLNRLTFVWDGKDAAGRSLSGEMTAKVRAVYKYNLVYLRASSAWSQAWAQAGGSSTNVIGRDQIAYDASKTITLNVESASDNGFKSNSNVANGWTFSNVHDMGTNVIYKGDGTKVKKEINLEDGLVAYYRFEGNARDSSGNGYDGIEDGNVQYTEGVIGKSLELDGSSRISLPSFLDKDIANGLTYTYWFKKQTSRYEIIFSQYTWDSNGHVFTNGIKDSSIFATYFKNLSGTWSDSVVSMYSEDFQWHHVLVNSTPDKLQIWLDGQLTAESPKTQSRYATNSSIQTYIGDTGISGTGSDKHFRGKIDDFRIYNRGLTPKEIQAIYNQGISYFFDGLNISDNTLEYQFNIDGKHLSTKSYPDRTLLETFTYDNNGNLTAITDRFGQTTTITRDSRGYPTQITAPNGQVTTLSVDENGDLVEVGYEDNAKYTFTYFEGSLMDTMRDPNGNLISHAWDSNGRIVEEVDGLGGSYRFLRDVTGDETFYSTILPEGETTTSTDVTLSNGDTQSTITLPTGETVTATFAKDESSTTIQRDGVETTYTYTTDTLTHQRILASKKIKAPSGLTQTTAYATTYDGNETHTNSKTQTISLNSKATVRTIDYNTGTDTLTTPEGRVAKRLYDTDTLLTQSIAAGTLTPVTYSYDDKGRVTKESVGNRETAYTYDTYGNVASITDPRGQTTHYSYDIVDRLTEVTYANGTKERFSYDNNGNLLTRTVPTPATHSFTYNGGDLRSGYTSALNKETTYTYDKSKHLTQIVRPSGKQIDYTYTNGRLEKITTPESTIDYSYLFADKVGSLTKGSEKIEYAYDGTLLTTITQSGTLNQSIGYTYDNDFKITGTTYAGQTEDYAYDNDGLLTRSGRYSLTRDAQNGYVTQLTDGTLTQNRSYNNFGEITEVSDNSFGYMISQRDNSGAITQKQESIGGTTVTYDYSYDERGRLIEVKKEGTTVESYTYDANGNRASATVNGVTTTASYTLDDQLEVYGNNSYRYDDDGYLIEKTAPEGTTSYSYNALGALIDATLPDGTQIHYITDPLNRRIAKEVNGTITEKYLWEDLTTLLAVYDSNNNLIQRFEYADGRMPVSMTDKDGKRYYLHYDQVGSLRAVSDANHNIVKEITYDTYGNIINDTNPSFKVPFGFAGGLYDSDTKLTHFGFREYDAYTGKWTAKDPIGFAGGDSNLYGYVWADPVNWIDENGLTAIAIPFTPTISPITIFPTLGAGMVYESAMLGYDTGYALAEWWDHYGENDSVMDDYVCYASEHTKNKRPSSRGKHEKGQKRKNQKYNDKKRKNKNWKSRK